MMPSYDYYRKAIHLFSLVIPALYWYVVPSQKTASVIIVFFTLIFILFDYLRFKSKTIKLFFSLFFDKMLKDHELKGKLTGASWVMISSSMVIVLFSKEVAVISLVFLSIGDTAAGLFGRNYGKARIGNKTFEGFIAGFFSCLIISFFYKPLQFSVTALGAFFGMLFETLPLPLDDNLKIPIASSVALSILIGLN